MGLYQVSSNNRPGVKFDPTPGVTSFTRDYIGFMKQGMVKSLLLQHNTLRDQNTILYGTVPGNEEMPE